MSQRRRSRARRDPDLDDTGSPPRRRSDDDEDEEGNEDLTLEIVARASRRREAAGGQSGLAEVISLSSDEEVDEDAVVELGDADPRRKKDKKKKRRKERRKKQRKEEDAATADKEEPQVAGTQEGQNGTSKSVLIEDGVDAPVSDNSVLRKLLRIPRYFDPGETILETCFNCGEEGHVAVNCPMEKRKKPCFVCGLFGHNAKACTQGQDCFICKKGGHMAKDCPDKHIKNTQQCTSLCLRCGETGHDMFGCSNDYPADEVKEIKCYVCKQNGHLCCTDFSDSCLKEVTCYNCAESGHTGLGCAKQRRETSVATTPTLCYKCGEDGHFARGCTNSAKPGRFKGGDSSSHSRKKEKWKNDSGHRSSPHSTHKRKSPLFEDRWDTPRGKSRVRGGWIPDDHDDLPYKKYKANGWGGSSTPKKPYNNHHHQQHSSGGDYSTHRGQDFSWHNAQYSPSARKHGSSSSSRFSNNTHHHFERS